MRRFSTRPSSRSVGQPVMFGLSVLLTAAGQSRICTGFPSRRSSEEAPPASDAQHIVWFRTCQSKCCWHVAAPTTAREIDSPHPNVELDPFASNLLTSVASEIACRGAVSQWWRCANLRIVESAADFGTPRGNGRTHLERFVANRNSGEICARRGSRQPEDVRTLLRRQIDRRNA